MAEVKKRKTVFLIGVGPGWEEGLTREASKAIEASSCIIGAKRLLISFAGLLSGKPQQAMIKAQEIADYLWQCAYFEVAVLLSGDLGFYSGGKQLTALLDEENYCVKKICGISSLVYFCNRLNIPWEDVKVVSLHGRDGCVLGPVMNYERVFFLTGGVRGAADICQELEDNGLGALQVAVGENLSYFQERIVIKTARELAEEKFANLCVMLVENTQSFSLSVGNYGLPDDGFLRGNTPMTKEEVRAVSLSKLRVEADSVAYDIGAGTGSVAAEIAMRAKYGAVYAIEKEGEALTLLHENRRRLGLYHMKIVAGKAPEALLGLPAADRVFIGGSSGRMEEILSAVLRKNPAARVVVNAITLETLTQTVSLFGKFCFIDTDICQIAVSKAKKVGNVHMMMGQNPVYIVSGRGNGAVAT